MLFWTNPGNSILQNSSCTATYLLSSKLSKTDVLNSAENVSDILWWTPIHKRTSVGQPTETYINQLCANIENLAKAMVDKDGWWMNVKGICSVNNLNL